MILLLISVFLMKPPVVESSLKVHPSVSILSQLISSSSRLHSSMFELHEFIAPLNSHVSLSSLFCMSVLVCELVMHFSVLQHAHMCSCVHGSIESSAASGKGTPAKWQMVGINNEHTAHMAAKSPTCLLSSLDTFCTLFVERNYSLHLQNSFTSASIRPSNSNKPHYTCKTILFVSSRADYVRCYYPERKYHCLKTNKLKEQDGPLSLNRRLKIGSKTLKSRQ